MKKGVCKRSLSLLLAIVLVAGMLPRINVFAAESATTSFDFFPRMINRCEKGVAEKTAIDPRTVTEYFDKGQSDAYPTYFRDWKYFGDSLGSYAEMSNVYGTYFDGGSMGGWIGFKVRGLNRGKYNVIMNRYAAQKKGCVYGLYILDADKFADVAAVTTAIKAGSADGMTKVGEADVYACTASSIDFGEVSLAKDGGEYIIVLRGERKGVVDEGEETPSSSSYAFLSFTGFDFEAIEELDRITAKDMVVTAGDKVSPEIFWIGVSGSECAGGKVIEKIEIVENDGSVILANDGNVYAVREGNAKIKITGHLETNLGGSKTSEPVKITVKANETIRSGEAPTFEFIAKPIISNEKSGTDFEFADSNGKNVNPLTLTNYYDKESGTYKRNWKIFAETLNSASCSVTDNNGMYFDGDKNFGDWLAIKVKGLPGGTYNVSVGKPSENRKGCIWAIYILDAEKYTTKEEITEAFKDNITEGVIKVGERDFYGSAASSIDFGSVTLPDAENGEHLVVFRTVGAGVVDDGETPPYNSAGTIVMSSTEFIAMKSLTFDGTYFESVDTEFAFKKLGNGEQTEIISTKGKKNTGDIISDMSDIALVNYEVVEGGDVLKVENDGKTFTAIGEGTAVVETAVIHEDNVIFDRDTIEVGSDYGIASLSIRGETEAYKGDVFRFVPLVKLVNGDVVVPAGAKISYEILDGEEYVTVNSDTFVAGNVCGEASVKIKIDFRGKTLESDAFKLIVSDTLKSLSGELFTTDINGAFSETSVGEYRTAKISVPAKGRYQVTVNAETAKTSGIVDFYAIPYSEEVGANPEGFMFGAYNVFSADMYSRSPQTANITASDVFFSEPGEYLIIMKVSGKNQASTGYDGKINSITFDGISFINKVIVSASETKLGMGETVDFEVKAYLSNGVEIPSDVFDVECVFDENLLVVDTENNKVTTKSDIAAATKANMTVKVSYKDYVAEEIISFSIDKNYGANPEKKALLYGETSIPMGSKISLTPAIELSNRTLVQASADDMVYEIVSNDAGAIAFDTDNVTLKAVSLGNATIKAQVTFRGNVYESEEVVISVVENASIKDLEINFTKGGHIGDGFETLDSAVTYTQNRDWIFYEIVGNDKTQKLKMETAQAQLNFDPDEEDKYLALKVRISGSGTYDVTAFSNKCRSRAGQFDMYIFPATKENMSNIPAKLSEENYVGYMDFYNETTTSNGVPSEIIDVKKGLELTVGEYLMVLELVPRAGSTIKNSRGDVVYPTYIHFTDVNSMANATLSAETSILDVGAETNIITTLYDSNNRVIEKAPDSVVFRTSDANVATVSEDGVVVGVSEGEVEIRANVTYGEITKTAAVSLYVRDASDIRSLTISAPGNLYIYGSDSISVIARMASGKTITIPDKFITWTVSDNDIAEILDGRITGKAAGAVKVSASVSDEYKQGASSVEISPATVDITWDSNATPTLFTVQERENVAVNASKYAWARDMVKSAKAKADTYLENFDVLYDMIVPEGLPRYYHVGNKYDDAKYNCRYCNYDIGANVNIYGWTVNPFAREWKIQCPGCKRMFPSNDFGSFYELGVTESGSWNYEKALQKHHELFVCEDVENGGECTHTPPAETAPKAGSQQWIANDPRDAEWYEYYGYGVKGGYLNNDLYREMDEKLGVSGWGVDDGFGYRQPYVSDPTLPGYHPNYNDDDGDGYARFVSGTREGPVQHTYIAYYLHEGVWLGAGGLPQSSAIIKNAMTALKNAFLYTGEAKYGRAGAILLDKIADMFPDYDWYQWKYFRGDNVRGTIVDAVWITNLTINFTECCDAFLPMYNDSYVIDFLSKNRARYEVDEETGDWKRDENGELIPVNLKDSPGAIRKNAEDGILITEYKATREGKLYANFGPEQETVGKAAIVINRMPETKEMLDWVFNYGEPYNEGDYKGDVTGGDVLNKIIDDVDRDGNGGENAPQYNMVWVKNLANLADELSGYELYPTADLFKNPKYVKMLTGQIRQTLGGYYTPQTGDSGYTASHGMYINLSAMLTAFKHTRDRLLARAIWKYNEESNGGVLENLHGSVFDTDAEQLMRDIEKIVEEDGEFDLDSDLMAGYGFAALRAGANYNSVSSISAKNTNRDFAIYFGASDFHGHPGLLNLYISAFGLNMAPDLGYPASTGVQPNRYQWVRTTLSHNTVVVDESEQLIKGETGMAYHFDDSGRVKVMDASVDVYAQTDDYRRSLIMVDVNDDVSYGVDFFHVKGGNDHLYSFHSQSDEICDTEGLGDVTVQPSRVLEDGTIVGTYAGADVAYGGDPGGNAPENVYPLGYTWLKNVRTYNAPENDFSVEFKLKDWNHVLSKKSDLRLRMTMVSDEPMNEVTFATGEAPQRGENKNIGELEYVLVRNKGKNLDTTFTTVFEPYEAGNKYIKDITKLQMVRKEGSRPGLSDSFSAVKVEHTSGRVDYVIYSTNTEVEYTVTDVGNPDDVSDDVVIDFCGFAGVLTVERKEDGTPATAYSYLNDGTVLKLRDEEEKENKYPAAYSGRVESFTTKLAMENSITITLDDAENLDLTDLSGKYVYIENDGVGNGIYKIEGAEKSGDSIKLDIGNTSIIRNYLVPTDISAGYVYNIAKGQSLRIPMSNVYDNAPVVKPISNVSATAGSVITIPFEASSPMDKEIIILSSGLPRGMSIDSDARKLTWKPSVSQVGENHVALTVSDGTLETTVHFTVTVYGSTSGGITTTPNNGATSGNSGGSGGGGGGGGATAPTTPDKPETPEITEGFCDLGNHAWAADAINTLADKGIIRGTSAITYSPEKNITRADFALLLVRAFEKESDNTENFADVSESDYFAKELAIARNTGLVGGIGDNKFAPRDNIKRCDMMLMVYRVLKDSDTLVGADIIRPQYEDFESVPDYAKEAVSALIGAGLVNGKNNLIAPNDNTTRAEVAVLLKRVLEFVEK